MKLRRRISILLSMLLLLSVFQPAVALNIDTDFEQIYEIGTRLLGDVEHEKELYGLGGVDFDNLHIGEHIPAYIAEETGLTPSEIRYYPVLENGKWVATLTCSKSNGIWNAQLSNAFVEELPEIGVNDKLKLVFDSNAGYLAKDSAVHKVSSYTSMVADKLDLASSPMAIREVSGQKLVNKRAVEIGMFDSNVQSRASLPRQVLLQVPLVSKFLSQTQYNDHVTESAKAAQGLPYDSSKIIGACWAATARAIGLKYDIDKSIDQIYNYAGIQKYKPGSNGLNDTERVLRGSLYGLTCTRHGSLSLSYEEMQQKLNAGYPIAAQVIMDRTRTMHAIAIRGYSRYENSSTHMGSYSYVENEYFPARYVASSVAWDQQSPDYVYPYLYEGKSGIINSFSVVSN